MCEHGGAGGPGSWPPCGHGDGLEGQAAFRAAVRIWWFRRELGNCFSGALLVEVVSGGVWSRGEWWNLITGQRERGRMEGFEGESQVSGSVSWKTGVDYRIGSQ